MNQRGGRPGFVRVRSDGRTLVIPDYSGNRFMQSLGNIEHTPVAGVTIPGFVDGSMLYVTGVARNHYGEDAKKIMLQARLVTTVEVTGYTFVADALPVRQSTGSPILRSPYSPPVRYLLDETQAAQTAYADTTLTLTKMALHAPTVATFTFAADPPIERIVPGQAAIIDFSSLLGTYGYRHMASVGAETTLNDDGVRTWTVSSSHPTESGPVREFSITMKEKSGGAVTGRLLNIARAVAAKRPELLRDTSPLGLQGKLVGVGGTFALPEPDTVAEGKPAKLLFVAGGIGVTPFLSMLSALASRETPSDVLLLVSTREPALVQALVRAAVGESTMVTLQLKIFDTNAQADDKFEVQRGRITIDVLKDVDVQRQIYVCGPRTFEESIIVGLEAVGVDPNVIHKENFDY